MDFQNFFADSQIEVSICKVGYSRGDVGEFVLFGDLVDAFNFQRIYSFRMIENVGHENIRKRAETIVSERIEGST